MPTIDGVPALENALFSLRQATSALESATAERDREIERITVEYGPKLDKQAAEIAKLEAAVEEYFRAHQRRLTGGKTIKSVQLTYGTLGLRSPSTPGLIPLNEKWTWDRITKRVQRLYKSKFFHPPKLTLDKRKIRAELTPEELRAAGMRLDDEDAFFYELADSLPDSRLPGIHDTGDSEAAA